MKVMGENLIVEIFKMRFGVTKILVLLFHLRHEVKYGEE